MISTLKNKRTTTILFIGMLLFGGVTFVHAQGSLSLSVSPTLVELGSQPGDIWRSSVKVINSNDYPLTVYGSVVNFVPEGEGGQGVFESVSEDIATNSTLAEWVSLEESSLVIPSQSSADIPFVVDVPADAQPGGHFAAILIGTQPPDDAGGVAKLRTSQVVTSLFFLRVDGEVIEDGRIRSFTANNSYTPIAASDFTLRFENNGNVHLRPQGDIVIYNMWGKERGRIPINQYTSFGNALPGTVRKYEYSWEGSFSLADIGLYRAEASIAYGTDARNFSNQSTSFWVIPVKALVLTIGIVISVIVFGMWAVRAYIRRIFNLAGIDPQTLTPAGSAKTTAVQHDLDIRDVSAPVRKGVSDLRERFSHIHAVGDVLTESWRFIKVYHLFFLGLVGFIVLAWTIIWYVGEATTEDTGFQVQIGAEENPVDLNAEEVMYMRVAGESVERLRDNAHERYAISLINTSGTAGTAGTVAARLTQAMYPVIALEADPNRTDERSIVVFPADLQNEALAISEILSGALLSATTELQDTIIIYIGSDQIAQ